MIGVLSDEVLSTLDKPKSRDQIKTELEKQKRDTIRPMVLKVKLHDLEIGQRIKSERVPLSSGTQVIWSRIKQEDANA